jgi:hypothetical protein
MAKKTDLNSLFSSEKLIAWCIIPYDSHNRNATERAFMLKRLGLTRLAWDWRREHLPFARHEFEVMKASDIDVVGIWIWINQNSLDSLSVDMVQLIDEIIRTGMSSRLWIGFDEDIFTGLKDSDKIRLVCEILDRIHVKINGSPVGMALYNHGGWLGQPEVMVSIVKATVIESLGIVYNLHHAHDQIHNLKNNLELMLPYLVSITMNGMELNGPKILDIGLGSWDEQILNIIAESGFDGDIGILGHTQGEDVELVLNRNLKGIQKLLSQWSG